MLYLQNITFCSKNVLRRTNIPLCVLIAEWASIIFGFRTNALLSLFQPAPATQNMALYLRVEVSATDYVVQLFVSHVGLSVGGSFPSLHGFRSLQMSTIFLYHCHCTEIPLPLLESTFHCVLCSWCLCWLVHTGSLCTNTTSGDLTGMCVVATLVAAGVDRPAFTPELLPLIGCSSLVVIVRPCFSLSRLHRLAKGSHNWVVGAEGASGPAAGLFLLALPTPRSLQPQVFENTGF